MGFKGKYYMTPGRTVPDELIRRHLDTLLKSREQGDIPSPLRLYIASPRIDVARKGGPILSEVPLSKGPTATVKKEIRRRNGPAS